MLSKKVVVVTGGAGRIGFKFCEEICKQGGIAILADVDQNRCETLIGSIKDESIRNNMDSVSLDICKRKSIDRAIEDILERHGKIDALVNNAYPRNENYGRQFFDVNFDDFCENLGSNLGGYFNCSQGFSEYFLSAGRGNIVNVASVYGVIAPRFEIYNDCKMTMPVEYAAIKSGVIHLTKYLASFFKGKNIRVNTISPGGIIADQPEPFINAYASYCFSKGMLDSDDLVGSLVFLLSDMSSFIQGQNIVVDDGFTL